MVEQVLVGVDWDSQGYEVCFLDAEGSVAGREHVKHKAADLAAFIRGLLARVAGDASAVAVGIETPRGALVDMLLERKVAVYAINPKQSERLRDRHRPSGAKDDPIDAYVLADALRNDRHLFRRVEGDHALVVELREVTRADENLAQEWTRLSNQVHDQLQRTHPHLLELVGEAQRPWFWEIIELVVMRDQKPSLSKLQRILSIHRIRRFTAEDVYALVRQPMLQVAPGTLKAVQLQLKLLLPRLRLVDSQRKECKARMEELLTAYVEEQPPGKASAPTTVEILRSLPGIGTRVASILLAEASHLLESGEAATLLRVYGGVAPVTKRSGKKRTVVRRYSCNHRLEHALFHQARTSMQKDALARAYYASLRARGHTHGRALRALADRWLRILHAMLKTRTLYNPMQLRAANSAAAAGTRAAA